MSFGHTRPNLSRLQQHGALSDDEDVLMTGAELPSHITARHHSQGGFSYTTAPANGRSSFASSDAVQKLVTLRNRHAEPNTREDELVRLLFNDNDGLVPLSDNRFDGYAVLQRITQRTIYGLIKSRALIPFTGDDVRYNA